jgi:hypothetical protein
MFREAYKEYVYFYQNEQQKQQTLAYLDKNRPSRLKRCLYRNSYFLRALLNRRGKSYLLRKNLLSPNKVGLDIANYTEEELSQRIATTFQRLSDLAEAKGFRLLVIPVPTREDPNASMRVLTENITQEIHDGLGIVNVVPELESLVKSEGLQYQALFWKYDNHFNSVGNRLFGTALSAVMKQHVSELIRDTTGHD